MEILHYMYIITGFIIHFVDNGETVIIAKPLQTMGPPFPVMEVRCIFCCHLNFLLTGALVQSFNTELKHVTESSNLKCRSSIQSIFNLSYCNKVDTVDMLPSWSSLPECTGTCWDCFLSCHLQSS